MELYIDKVFLDNFYIDLDENPVRKIVESLFCDYGDKNVFMNIKYDGLEVLENLKYENEIFAKICSNDKPPFDVLSIKDHLFTNSNFQQSLIFMSEEQDWFKDAEKNGALCFSYNNYIQKIEDITNRLHFRIDLSGGFKGWDFLKLFKSLNFNHLMILDGYILGDKDNQKMDENFIPIIKNILTDKEKFNVKVDILTKELNPLTDTPKHKKEKCKKVYKKLNREFANYQSKFTIVLNNFSRKFDFHDRTIATNYSLIDSGKGFNLIPHKASNSQLISETIFDKYTYNRLKRIKKEKKSYLEKLRELETNEFKGFPENTF